jgi:hypothetical protein
MTRPTARPGPPKAPARTPPPALPSRPEPTPAGTQRRLQALAARGWWPGAIARATGIPAPAIAAATTSPRTRSSDLDQKVADAYDQLWDQQPPASTGYDLTITERTRGRAARLDWPPPMAWDDDLIDQPDAAPAPGWKPTATTLRHSADLAEDAAWLREHGGYSGSTDTQIAMRLGVAKAALQVARVRAARYADRQAEAG